MVSGLDVASMGAIFPFGVKWRRKRNAAYWTSKGFKIIFIPILVPPSILASKRAEPFVWMLFIYVKR
jgi:hypothetical protein